VLSLAQMEINVLIEKEFKKQVNSVWLKNIIGQVLNTEKVGVKAELGLVITNDEKIRELNLKYLEEDRPTDVLSFPMNEQLNGSPAFTNVPDGKLHLGEIIISYPQAVKQAEEHNHPAEKEIVILLIHGILHLLGYDHDIPLRIKTMRSRESAILKIIEE
jgi:probable rRNA maturation factor